MIMSGDQVLRPGVVRQATVVAVFMQSGLATGVLAAQNAPLLSHRAEQVVRAVDFGRPTAVVVNMDGRLHAAYATAGLMRIIDALDGVVQEVRLPRPPASSRFPGRIGWVGDTLWVADGTGSIVAFLGDSMAFVRTSQVALPGRTGEILSRRFVGVLPGRRLIVTTTAPLLSVAYANARAPDSWEQIPPQLFPAEAVSQLPVWLTDFDGSVLDTVLWLSVHNHASLFSAPPEFRPERPTYSAFVQPFADNALMAIDAKASYIAVVDRSVNPRVDPPVYAVHLLDVTGDTLLTQRYTYDPIPLREQWIENAAWRNGKSITEDPPEVIVAAARDALFRPRWLPPVSDVRVGPTGWVWVRREDVPDSPTVTWDILNELGKRLGSIRLPASLAVEAVTQLEAWATESVNDDSSALWHIRVSAHGMEPATRR